MAESGSRAVARYRQSRPWRRAAAPLEEPQAPPPLSVAPLDSNRTATEPEPLAIDLLNPTPAVIVDREQLSWTVGFGFVGGDVCGALHTALQRAPVAPSDFEPESFAAGVFVADLIRTCMRVRVGALEPAIDALFVARVLTHAPRELSVIEYRRDVLRELAGGGAHRAELEALYTALHQLRALLDAQGSSADLDGRTRRLETLVALRDVLALMARTFENAHSGLSRIRRFGERALASDGYRKLVELLDYENHLASVELKLRIGADGKIRRFEIEHIRENRDNPFHQSAFGRWWTRVRMWLRGYSLGETELVNRWVDTIFEGVQELVPPLLQLLGEIEVYLAVLAFKDGAERKGLSVCLPELSEDRSAGLAFTRLYNPLLFSQGITPVPCDLRLDEFQTTTLLTGPNSGGKTRVLQALAIAQMLGQAGFFVPAERATLGCARGLFVSLIEEARADQKEGRLGTELVRIRTLFERSRRGSLIILDELCSGTNPSEGEDIIRLVLTLLGELDACVFITTHFLQFARRLSEEPAQGRLSFLQVELDEHEHPTYQFVPGVAHTSLAHQTAARLGVTREQLLALVRRERG